MVVPKEDGEVLVVTVPVFSDSSISLSPFAVWLTKGPAISEKIFTTYASFEADEEDYAK